jgi:hypothetical protein
MHTLLSWFEGRNARPRRTLLAEAHVTEEWQRFTGREHYAKVTLAGYPAKEFSLESLPSSWRSEAERQEYEPYVLDGVLGELFVGPHEPIVGIRVVVEATVTHASASNGNAFFQAAKRATERLLSGPGGGYHSNVANAG